ncbi:TPA: hypothetical protein LA742_001277 [Clostridium botulinum]|uniref:hypothetical protein n=1 Tax=Clostridium sporogenes TaxID=1509 RepID=UPI000774E28E|nr:hypothetical protein [Clostridium sporogenes]AUM93682.1 hypothetical protein RSJ11_00215 [Clostridium sporogenes]HBJ2612843.1 hypothetical protein [Clostridium botulinum]
MNKCIICFLNKSYEINFLLGDIEINSDGEDIEIIREAVGIVTKNNNIRLNQLDRFEILVYNKLIEKLNGYLTYDYKMLNETKTKLEKEIERIKIRIKVLDE